MKLTDDLMMLLMLSIMLGVACDPIRTALDTWGTNHPNILFLTSFVVLRGFFTGLEWLDERAIKGVAR